ncbi:MAG: hypothetical protein ACTHLE_19000 [Agriterribacter sp.]
MKHLIAFILLLASSICVYIFACGPQYPDEVRFNILKPAVFQQKGFDRFHYSKHLFEYPYEYEKAITESAVTEPPDENIALWRKYCKNQVSIADAEQAVYSLSITDIKSGNSNNGMIKYLLKTNDQQAIDYIFFAKSCEPFNRFLYDPWERSDSIADARTSAQRHSLMEVATERAAKGLSDIQLRYAFLAIRLAYYNSDFEEAQKLYQQFFSSRKQKNIIDYWALYFYATLQPESALTNLNIARVYAHAPDKRMAVVYDYKKDIPLNATLKLAQNKNDQCDVYLMDAVRNPGRALKNLKSMQLLNAKSEYLDFLLLREINKLEDWLYTPAYYLFPPSISFDPYAVQPSHATIFKNVERDMAYAREVLAFVDSVNAVGAKNKILWNTAMAYLHLMLKEYDKTLAVSSFLKKDIDKNSPVLGQLQMIEALALTAKQEKDKAAIPETVKPLLLKAFRQKNYAFIFAIAKELEYKNNTTDAALLISKVNQEDDFWLTENVYWKNSRGINNQYVDFYWEYFGYLDAQYTADQLHALISNIKNESNGNGQFLEWKYNSIKNNMSRMYDLLGTKYMRENKLEAALKAFKNVNDTLWYSKYYPYDFYLAANPFYTNMYNEHRPTHADTVRYTKTTITSTLIEYLKKADDPSRNDRDYYYFLAANCYLNMTQYGNSWMMRRYYWSASANTTGIVDDNEYLHCNLARKYYLEAKRVSKSKKFAALCLRMAGRCESYRSDNDDQNRYYSELKKLYPEYYDDLISNCESFEHYFAARNKR